MVFFDPLESAAGEPMEDESLKNSGFSGRLDAVVDAIMEDEEDASIVAIRKGAAIALAGRPRAKDEKART